MQIDWTMILEAFGTIAVLAMIGGPPFYFAARAERRRREPTTPDFLDAFDDLILAVAGVAAVDANARYRDGGGKAR